MHSQSDDIIDPDKPLNKPGPLNSLTGMYPTDISHSSNNPNNKAEKPRICSLHKLAIENIRKSKTGCKQYSYADDSVNNKSEISAPDQANSNTGNHSTDKTSAKKRTKIKIDILDDTSNNSFLDPGTVTDGKNFTVPHNLESPDKGYAVDYSCTEKEKGKTRSKSKSVKDSDATKDQLNSLLKSLEKIINKKTVKNIELIK